jgi:hypothetical protein
VWDIKEMGVSEKGLGCVGSEREEVVRGNRVGCLDIREVGVRGTGLGSVGFEREG